MKIEEIVAKRIKSVNSDMISGAFQTSEELEKEIARVRNIMISTAVINGTRKGEAESYIEKNFAPQIRELYNALMHPKKQAPENYHFANFQRSIEDLIKKGHIEEAKERIEELKAIMGDKDSLDAGVFTEEDVEYFTETALKELQSQMQGQKQEKVESKQEAKKEEEEKTPGLFDRFKKGFSIIVGRNPYDDQKVKIKKEKVSISEKLQEKKKQLSDWTKKHKRRITAAGLAAIAAGGFLIGTRVHGKQEEAKTTTFSDVVGNMEDSLVGLQSNLSVEEVEKATFEVDQFHNFNMNDEQTHIEKLQLLARAFIERGIPVLSEEECMRYTNEGKLAVSVEQLDNWLISVNLEDITDLTFTKLLANSNTDKEELSSDFLRVSNLLGSIYTTKEENPFIYQFISNKEYSNYIKAYEEAMIQNQKGNKDPLIQLINSRAYNPVAGTHSGAIGMLSTSLIYQQANVYNAQIIGQDIMDLYNINSDCKTDVKTTFYSDDWAEYMRKLDSKLAVALTYAGSEKESFEAYLKTLTDPQDDNKVYIEEQVRLYLSKANIQLGTWDLIDSIANNRTVIYQGTGSGKVAGNATVSTPTTTKKRVVPKAPTTKAELAVKERVEKENAVKNEQSFLDTVNKFVQDNGATMKKDENGDIVVQLPDKDEQPIIIDVETMGKYDPEKDYKGPTYKNYDDYKEEHKDFVQYIEDIGEVVVPKEPEIVITNPNVHQKEDGTIVQDVNGKEQEVITGTEKEIDDYIEKHPDVTKEEIISEGEIQYSPVDDEPSQNYSDIEYGPTNQTSTNEPEPTIPPSYNTDSTPSGSQSSDHTNDIPDSVDEDVYSGLTPEEQEELKDMLNGGPVPGEIVDEVFVGIDDVSQHPESWVETAMTTQNIEQQKLPVDTVTMDEGIVFSDEPVVETAPVEVESESVVESTPVEVESEKVVESTSVEAEPEQVVESTSVEAELEQVVETASVKAEPEQVVETASVEAEPTISEQKEALEAVKAELTGDSVVAESEKTL